MSNSIIEGQITYNQETNILYYCSDGLSQLLLLPSKLTIKDMSPTYPYLIEARGDYRIARLKKPIPRNVLVTISLRKSNSQDNIIFRVQSLRLWLVNKIYPYDTPISVWQKLTPRYFVLMTLVTILNVWENLEYNE